MCYNSPISQISSKVKVNKKQSRNALYYPSAVLAAESDHAICDTKLEENPFNSRSNRQSIQEEKIEDRQKLTARYNYEKKQKSTMAE